MPELDASWIPLLALMIGLVTVTLLLKLIGTTFAHAMEQYVLICSARNLRNSHVRRLREIQQAVQRENEARAVQQQHRSAAFAAALRSTPPVAPDEEVVDVDVLEAA